MVSKLSLNQLDRVFGFLDPDSRGPSARVCRQWEAACMAEALRLRVQCVSIFEEARLGYRLPPPQRYFSEHHHWRFEITRYGPRSDEMVRLTRAASKRECVIRHDIVRWLMWTSPRRQTLPNALLRHAFQFCDPNSLVAIQLTGRGWKRAADQDGILSQAIRKIFYARLGDYLTVHGPSESVSTLSHELGLWHQYFGRLGTFGSEDRIISAFRNMCQLDDPTFIQAVLKGSSIIFAEYELVEIALNERAQRCLSHYVRHHGRWFDAERERRDGPWEWHTSSQSIRVRWTRLLQKHPSDAPWLLYLMSQADGAGVRGVAEEFRKLGSHGMDQQLRRALVGRRNDSTGNLQNLKPWSQR